jgi:UV DNA damage repair endonuclease
MDQNTKRAFENMVNTLQSESSRLIRLSHTFTTVTQVVDEFSSVLSQLRHDIQDALDLEDEENTFSDGPD